MIFIVFLLGSLLGLCFGALLCIRLVRQGVTEDLSPKLSRMQGQLNTIEAELAYIVTIRHAEIDGRPPHAQRQDV